MLFLGVMVLESRAKGLIPYPLGFGGVCFMSYEVGGATCFHDDFAFLASTKNATTNNYGILRQVSRRVFNIQEKGWRI